tara:strand:- start:648 stop:1175 length:528 start_codon:yes stop_codon:yes gene_type:complete
MTKKQSPLLRIRDYFLLPLVLAATLLIANQVTVMGLKNEASYMSLFDRNFFTFLPLATIGLSIGMNKKNLLIIFATSLLITLYISGPTSLLTALHGMALGRFVLLYLELKFNIKLVAKAFMLLIGFSIGLLFMTYKYASLIGHMTEISKTLIVEQFGDNEYLDFKKNFDRKMAEQ